MRFCQFVLILLLSAPCVAFQVDPIEAQTITQKIWRNEGNNNDDNLIIWANGEEFPSLGIGHFIWLPTTYQGPFVAGFPGFLHYAVQQGIRLPQFISHDLEHAPWQSKAEFNAAKNTADFQQLKQFLIATKPLQATFIINQFQKKLATLLVKQMPIKQEALQKKLAALETSSSGRYALMDYVNFKGLGDNPNETYAGQGWGLLQVLTRMSNHYIVKPNIRFANAAELVLKKRIKHSPPQRREARWLKGWLKRIDTYRD